MKQTALDLLPPHFAWRPFVFVDYLTDTSEFLPQALFSGRRLQLRRAKNSPHCQSHSNDVANRLRHRFDYLLSECSGAITVMLQICYIPRF